MAVASVRLRALSDNVAYAAGLDARLLGMILVLLAIWFGFDVLTGGIFLTARNLFNLSLQVSVVGIMTCGMVLVIVARQIDLSVGSQIGFIGVFGALLQTEVLQVNAPTTWWLTCLAMLALGVLIGAIQGALVAYAAIPSFVVTLGGLLFFRNAAYQINEGRTISPLDDTFQLLGGGLKGTIGELQSWIVAVIAIVGVALVVWRSRQRRHGHHVAQRPLAMDALVVGVWSLVIVGFVVVMNSYEQPKTGIPMGIPIPSLESGMILMGIPTPTQKMVLALVLVLAVWVDMTYRRKRLT